MSPFEAVVGPTPGKLLACAVFKDPPESWPGVTCPDAFGNSVPPVVRLVAPAADPVATGDPDPPVGEPDAPTSEPVATDDSAPLIGDPVAPSETPVTPFGDSETPADVPVTPTGEPVVIGEPVAPPTGDEPVETGEPVAPAVFCELPPGEIEPPGTTAEAEGDGPASVFSCSGLWTEIGSASKEDAAAVNAGLNINDGLPEIDASGFSTEAGIVFNFDAAAANDGLRIVAAVVAPAFAFALVSWFPA